MSYVLTRPWRAVFAITLAFSSAAVAQVDDDDLLILDDSDDEKAAPAGPQKKVGMVPLVAIGDASEALAESVSSGIKKELADGAFAIEALAVTETASGAKFSEDAGAKSRAAGDKRLAKGKDLLAKRRMGQAQKQFERALAEYAKGAAAMNDVTGPLAAWAGIAEVNARQGKDEASAAALESLARLNPEHALDAEVYPPAFLTAFTAASQKVLEEKTGTVSVDATAAGATVWVNGREVGRAPIKVTGVLPGKTYVRALREGVGAFGVVVEVKPEADAKVSPGFQSLDAKGPVDLLKQNNFSPDAAKAVAAAAKAKGYDAALVGVVAKTDKTVPTTVYVIDANTAKARRVGPLDLDTDLLNLTIEGVKLAKETEKLLGGEGTDVFVGELIPGVKAGAAAPVAEVAIRFDAPQETRTRTRRRSRLNPDGDEEERRVLSGGRSRTSSLKDDDVESGLRAQEEKKKRPRLATDEDIPLTEQAWFWPTVIGGGVASAVAIGGITYAGLVAGEILPDPRPRNGARVVLVIPE
jgi:hypothetical protein